MKQSCELCGSPGAKYIARVAGTEAMVCERCASMGTIISELSEKPKASEIKKIEKRKGDFAPRREEVVADIGEIVRKKREENGWKQEELGKRISEHASMLRRIEHGYIPSIKIARKLEKVLRVRLIEELAGDEQGYSSGAPAPALTLGDVITIRRDKGR